ncbi:SufE family protein [Candidatus Marinimicrobia bacterium]|jgi:cysteine desulfuration protein SufE|nr:SufE family protein [Candidatus Neomarinimicrobiota bacterium]|tara:strand:- start:3757 stop:4164 length:408 start_codon:yes stop_codon:yes gene_type:complete
MKVQENLDDLHNIFSMFEDPKDKFIQLMDIAKDSTSFLMDNRTNENKINGCTSQAWVVVIKNDDKTYSVKTDSDAQIVKGLLTILEKIFYNQPAKEILSISGNQILSSIGLDGSISSQRTNGFSSAIEKIQGLVR